MSLLEISLSKEIISDHFGPIVEVIKYFNLLN